MSDNLLCPYCSGTFQHDPALAGQRVACPHCSRPFAMPAVAAPPQQGASPPAPPHPPPPPPGTAHSGTGFPHIATDAIATGQSTAGGRLRRKKQAVDPKTLLVVGAIAGGGVLLLVVGSVAFFVAGAFSSNSDGGLTSMLPDSVNLPLPVDPQVTADREAMKNELLRQHAGQELKIIEWADPQTNAYVVVFQARPPVQGVVMRTVPSPDDVPALQRQLEQEDGHSYDVAKVEPKQMTYAFVFEVTQDGERVVYDGDYSVTWNHEAAIERDVLRFKTLGRRVSLGSRLPRIAVSSGSR